MEKLIKNAHIVDCSKDFYGDVYINEGIISEVGQNLHKNCEIIDGKGLILMPSFIDLHAHFRDPGLTYKEDILSGSMAAVKGGYTAVNLMANTKPVCSTMEIVKYVKKKAKDIGIVDVHQTVSITKDMEGKDTSHLDKLEGIGFISDDGKGVLSDRIMLEAMEKAKKKGMTVISHAENGEITPVSSRLSENLMTIRDIYLSAYCGCRLHIAHVSTKEAMEEIIRAKSRGCNVTCEVMPHNIALNNSVPYSVNPPLREDEDIKVLINAIKDGWVDAIATDHAPHSVEDKLNGVPGISGIETSFSVCYTKLVREGHITLNKLSCLMSKNPGKMMGLNKGEIKAGYDGDLVLVDIDKRYAISSRNFVSKGKNTPFEGMEVYGEIIMTIKGGKAVYRRADYDNRQIIRGC